MKRILAFAAAAACAMAFAKSKGLSKAQIEKNAKIDKANWGGVDYSAASDGENSTANDLAQMRSMARGEAATMKKLYDLCKTLIFTALVDMEPESVLGDALKQLGRPIDPTPPRTHSNMSATPAQKLGFKSLAGAKRAVAKFGEGPRPKMAALLKAEIETRLYSGYNRLARVTTLEHIRDGSLIESFKRLDKAWGKYQKLVEKIADGTDKWRYTPQQLADPATKKKLFADVLKESGMDCMLDADGRILPKSSRYFYVLDGYFKRTTDDELKKFETALDRSWTAHEAAADALKAYVDWFAKHGMELDPYPRQFLKELVSAHRDYLHKSRDLLGECKKVLGELRNDALPVCKLRKCKGFSPNKALFVRTGPPSGKAPGYVKRMNELSREVKIRFGEAVRRRIDTAGRKRI